MSSEIQTAPPTKKLKTDTDDEELQKTSTLDKFYRDLEQNVLCFKMSKEEVEDLQNAMFQIVKTILDECGKFDCRYKCSELLSVGSFNEGTKIVEPNEFDFLAVIDDLSEPGVIEVKRICNDKVGFAHIFVHGESQQERWKHFILEGQLHSFLFDVNPDVHTKERNQMGFSGPIDDVFKRSRSSGGIKIAEPTGELSFEGVRHFDAPNTVIYLSWCNKSGTTHRVTADISPAIRCTDCYGLLLRDDCLSEKYFKELVLSGSFLLVPGKEYPKDTECQNRCFRLSFTETEVKLVKKLHPIHHKCLRIVKYIFVYCNKFFDPVYYPGFSSYVLKTVVLHHSSLCDEPESVSNCMKKIVDVLFQSLMMDEPYLPNLPSIFIQEHNLFRNLNTYQTVRVSSEYLLMHIHSVIAFHFLQGEMNKINNSEYSFEKGMKLLNTFHKQLNTVVCKIRDRATEMTKAKWSMPISSKELVRKFGVPFVKIQEEEMVELKP